MHLVGGGEPALGVVDVHRVDPDGLLLAEVVQRAVAGDAVQPRPHVEGALVRVHGVERRREHLLEDVLGVLLGAEHVAAERVKPRLIAAHERLEGALVAASGQRDQTLVGLKPQQGRASMEAGHAVVLEG